MALAVAAVAGALASGCGTLKTRDDLNREAPPAPSAPKPAVETAPLAPPLAIPAPVIAPAPGVGQVRPVPAPPSPETPAFLKNEPPRVGLILGAGGMKAFAHVGVLKEFARARIPVAAIAGLEWGAAMAGIYALQGQANEVEWKSLRLRESELPESSFLSGHPKAQPIAILRDFLDVAFARATLERNRVEFGCPAYSPKSEKLLWLNRGSARDAIARCLAYPPFYLDAGGWVASPFAIEEAAAFLRSRGANFIIFVNPLAHGEMLPERAASDDVGADLGTSVLWSEIRRHANRPQIAGVNVTISINLAGYPITDFASRRQLMDLGAKASSDLVTKLAAKYGF